MSLSQALNQFAQNLGRYLEVLVRIMYGKKALQFACERLHWLTGREVAVWYTQTVRSAMKMTVRLSCVFLRTMSKSHGLGA